jgi:cephalosporin hydroxylase
MKTHKDIEGWYDWQKLTERMVMNQMPQHGTYIEVGVWKGKSLIAFGEQCRRFGKNAKLFGVDLFGGKQDDHLMDRIVAQDGGSFFGICQKNLLDCNIIATLIREDSVRAAQQFEDESADIILIDALHTYEAVKRDTLAWKPKLKRNGWMLWHDCDREEVRKAVREAWGPNFQIEKPRTGYARKV